MPDELPRTFENRDQLPLGELTFHISVDGGVAKDVPALDKQWTKRQYFADYTSMLTSNGRLKTGADLEEWQYDAECYEEDMRYLLQRSHHEFWSYMVYQKSAIAAVISFCQRATPFYIDLKEIGATPEHITLYQKVLNQTVRIVCRLITNKESSSHWISKEHMSDLIYTNYLITVPMLFDLLIALGDASNQNASILRRIFGTVLELQPKYKNDFLTALAFFRAAFRSIQTQVDNEGFEGAGGGTLDEAVETPYDDVSLYTLDCAYSLNLLLEICPSARTMCAEINLGKSIAEFYDTTIVSLYKYVFQINESATSLTRINEARILYLSAFRHISYTYVDAVLSNSDDKVQHAENYIALMTDCLSEETFVIDYERQYPVSVDMDILKQACPSIDEFKASYIEQGYRQESEEASSRTYDAIENLNKPIKNEKESDTPSASVKPVKSGEKKKKPLEVIERDIDLEVTAVLDMLPHLGTGFIRRVLSRYDNPDQAVAAILEENLPPDLAYVDQSEPYIPPDLQDKVYEETGVKHFNVFDGDAYDIMVHDKPNCIIKRGKGIPGAHKNVNELLDDKSDLQEIRHRYTEYSLVTEDDEIKEKGEYDDEYDDSYESLLDSETRAVKSKNLKKILANVEDVSEEDEDDEEVDDAKNEDSQKNKTMNFCENPEDVRARYEARREAKWSRRGGGNAARNEPKRDVAGAPKGQGQDKDTIRNRQKKETHKASRANHNRKAGASYKRSKGMFP